MLRASVKRPLLDWLRDNEYFVPATSDDAIDQYIHEGAYFLVLKLTEGRSMELRLNDGKRVVEVALGSRFAPPRDDAPYAARIEVLRLEGPPMIVTDNQALFAESDRMEERGCASTSRRRSVGGTFVAFFMIAMLARWFGRSTS